MTKEQFFSLPINRATVAKLRSADVFFTNAAYYSEFIKGINMYLALPKCVKEIHKVSIESMHNNLVTVKEAGYRKELKLEF